MSINAGYWGNVKQRLLARFRGQAQTREELLSDLRGASRRDLLGSDALDMIEGALQVSEMQVREIMVPRSQMVVVKENAGFDSILQEVVDSGHSRFPAIGGSRDEILGIMLAKELLQYCRVSNPEKFHLRMLLRPVVYVPGSKRLNVLLKEFRAKRNHMAIVVDEYGGVGGLVTIEDVLEQIVGEITDETDQDVDPPIRHREDGGFNVKALTPIEDFNRFFDTQFDDGDVDTIGGLVLKSFGHLPRRGETVEVGACHFTILNSDSRRVHLLRVELGSSAGILADENEP